MLKDVEAAALLPKMVALLEECESASPETRQAMANVSRVGRVIAGASKEQIEAVFGKACVATRGGNGMVFVQYELRRLADAEGLSVSTHLTFVFEDNRVTSVMGNTISF